MPRQGGLRQLRTLVAVAATIALLTSCEKAAEPPKKAQKRAPAPAPTIGFDEGRSKPVADPVYPAYGNPAIDVLHYDLTLDWAPQTKTLTGVAELAIRATKPVSEIALDFSAAYAVTKATVAGQPATPTRRGDKLVIPAAKPIPADGKVLAVVEYRGVPKPTKAPSTRDDASEGLGLRATLDGGAWTMQEPFGAFTWYPCSDQPSDEAMYDISLTAPAGWAGVASGTFAGRTGNASKFQSTEPVATYLTTLAFGKYTQTTGTGPRGIPIAYWTRPGLDAPILPWLKEAPKHLAWLEQKFGPYPMSSAGFVLVPSTSAMETQEMVTMGSKMALDLPANGRREVYETVMVHELAHQWFGNSVTPTDWRGIWLNEGWAMYAQGLYEISRGWTTEKDWEARMRRSDTRSRAEAGPPGRYDRKNFAEANVYVGPALMLHEIRKKLGDAKFFALGRDWVQTQRDTQQDRASFTAFVNKHTGQNLTPVIDKWLDSPTTPS